MILNVFNREIIIKKEILAAAVLCFVAAVGIAGFLISKNSGEVIINTGEKEAVQIKNEVMTTAAEQTKAEASLINSKDDEIKVYVVGCVKNEGIVTLKKGQLIDDAIKAAGGATADADLRSINLAFELNENVMLKIFSRKETQVPVQSKAKPAPPAAAASSVTLKANIVRDSGGAVEGDKAEGSKQGSKVNINTASVSELDTLPGVGEKTASDIIGYREKNGPFKKIEEIMNVPRIGDKRFSDMKNLITVD